jgi:DNA-binding transcriptional ArsR family regulator
MADRGDADIASLARLLADDSRAAILLALSDGRAQSAGMLAHIAGLRPSAATAHLAKLQHSGVLLVERRGRQRMYRISDAEIVRVLEAMAAYSGPATARNAREAYRGRTLHVARMCYDHLAGSVGVGITEALVSEGTLEKTEAGFTVSERGCERFLQLEVDVLAVSEASRRTRRPLTRACLDWTERRPHLAGALGAALASQLLAQGWFERLADTRALRITNAGRRLLNSRFGLRIW